MGTWKIALLAPALCWGQFSVTAAWQHPILGEQNLGNKIPKGLAAYEVRACNDGDSVHAVSERWIVAQVGRMMAVQDGEWIEQAIALYRTTGFWPTAGRLAGKLGPTVAGAVAGVATMNPLVGLASKQGIDFLVDAGKDKERVVSPLHWWRDSDSVTQTIPPHDCGRALIIAVAGDGKQKVLSIPAANVPDAIKESGDVLDQRPSLIAAMVRSRGAQ